MSKLIRILFMCILCFPILGCAVDAGKSVLEDSSESQLKLRQMQTRYFDTADKQKCMEAVLATLQDLGFVIDKASYDLGTVTSTKLSGYQIRMTVTVIPRGKKQMSVRANGQYNLRVIEDPRPYQTFFESLSKSLFLQAHME